MDRAIGVFDSGIGGLSVLKALRAALPHEHFIYIADSGHAPYGERDEAHVLARSRAIVQYLVRPERQGAGDGLQHGHGGGHPPAARRASGAGADRRRAGAQARRGCARRPGASA